MKSNFTQSSDFIKKRNTCCYFTIFVIAFFLVLLLPKGASAQIPGFIVQKATNGGEKVLDPNGDGYVSKTSSGFVYGDIGETYSEIPYRLFPQVNVEPHSDLKTGGSTNFTDLMKDPWYAYFDGVNFMFRVRVGNNSSASKGFSVLIDANNTFSGTGTNPGFEYEVLLATNFDVRIINLGNGQNIYTASHLSNSQRSVALSTTNDNADYFIDFYVPLSGFNGGITATTPLRFTGISVTSAQSGISGTAADIGGLNDLNYIDRNQAWTAVVNSFSPTSVNNILTGEFTPVQSDAPVVTGPISVVDALVSGTSTEAVGTVITVYQNTTLLGTTTVTAAGNWSLTFTAGTLTLNSNITVKAKNGTESLSNVSNIITVGQVSCAAPPPTPTLGIIPNSSKNIPITIANTTTSSFYFELYHYTAAGPVLVTTSPSLAAGTTTWTYTGTLTTKGEHYVVAVYANSTACVSSRSNTNCTQNNTTALAAPVINTTLITTATTSITGTVTAGSYITLFVDGVNKGVLANSGTTFTFSGLTLKAGQVITVHASADVHCGSTSTPITISRVAPVISGSYCALTGGSTLTFTGTSSEIGSTIRLYNAANGTQLNPTTIVNASTVWSLTVSGITPGNYYVQSTAADGSVASANSNTITVTSQTPTTGLTINSPITESAGSNGTVTGNATANSTVKVYIDGTLLGTTLTQANGTWSISGLSPLELYINGFVTATVTAGGTCESVPVNGSLVKCSTPPAAVTASFGGSTLSVCNEGTVSATITNSELNVAYLITLNGVATGNVTIGTGGTITVISAPLTFSGTLGIIAQKNFSTSCQTVLSATASLSIISPAPTKPVVTAVASSVCFGTGTNISVTSGLVANDKYQLKRDGVLTGTEVTYTSGTLTFPSGAITAASSFAVVHKNSTGCTSTSDAITVLMQSPSGKQSVTASKNSVCINETVSISVATEYGGATPFTYQVFQSYNGGTATQIGANIIGNGLVQTVTSPVLSTAGSYTYTVRVSSAACSNITLVQSQQVVVGTAPTLASAGGTIYNACNMATLAGNQPASGLGTWTVESKPVNASNPIFSNVNQYNSMVLGLSSGTYVFRWTISQTCNNGTTTSTYALQTVNANCPTTYNVNAPYFINGYQNEDVLAYPYDTEGFNLNTTNFSLQTGTLPPGVALNTKTGEIYVSNNATLALYKGPNYSFNLTINATDALSNTTTAIPVTLTFYPEASQATITKTPPAVLPVELLYFTGKAAAGQVNLVWATATEKNNKYFVVERSVDGKNFTRVGRVAGAGNSISEVKYTFTDQNTPQGRVYYRLQQIDFDDVYVYTKVIAVNMAAKATSSQLLAYPNPTTGQLNLIITATAPDNYTIEVRDIAGKLLLVKKTTIDTQTTAVNLDLQSLPAGTYLVTARSKEGQAVTRIVKN